MCMSNIPVINFNCGSFISRQVKRSKAARRRATRWPTWMVPINHLLCFIPVGGITDGEVNPDSDSISKGIFSQYCSLNNVQCCMSIVQILSASIASTIYSILFHHYGNALPNSRGDEGCSQGELVEGCGKGEKRMEERSSSFCSNLQRHVIPATFHRSWSSTVQPLFNFPLTSFIGMTLSSC